jgi:lipopolysaccharide export LptBFGC system permease protein LptF
MMLCIDRYLMRKAIVTLAVLLVLIVLVVIGLDLILRLKVFLRGDLPADTSRAGLIAWYYLHQLPLLVSPLLPIAVIVSAIITTAPGLKRGEFTALASAGVGLRRSCRSLLLFAGLVGLADLLIADQVAPRIEGRRLAIEDQLTGNAHTGRPWYVEQTRTPWFAQRVILIPGKPPVIENLAVPCGGGLLHAKALVPAADGGWELIGPIVASRRNADGTFRMETADRLPCTGELALPYSVAGLSQVLVSHHALSGWELLRRARGSEHGQLYLAYGYGRFARGLLPLLALLMTLPCFIRFENRDGLILASIRALVAGMVPLAIATLGGLEAYRSGLGPGPTIATSLALAALPGLLLYWRWRM